MYEFNQPRCQRCGSEDEYLMHMLFYCFMSRAVWYISPLGLKVDLLPMVLKDAMLMKTQTLDYGSITLFCFTLWSLWKARNDYIFGGIRAEPRRVVATAIALAETAQQPRTQDTQRSRSNISPIKLPTNASVVIIDASWKDEI
jgi:hypothetical protein